MDWSRSVSQFSSITSKCGSMPARSINNARRKSIAQFGKNLKSELWKRVAEFTNAQSRRSIGVQHQIQKNISVSAVVFIWSHFQWNSRQSGYSRESVNEFLFSGLRMSDNWEFKKVRKVCYEVVTWISLFFCRFVQKSEAHQLKLHPAIETLSRSIGQLLLSTDAEHSSLMKDPNVIKDSLFSFVCHRSVLPCEGLVNCVR